MQVPCNVNTMDKTHRKRNATQPMETRNKNNFMYSGICDWILLTGDEFWQMSFYKTKKIKIKSCFTSGNPATNVIHWSDRNNSSRTECLFPLPCTRKSTIVLNAGEHFQASIYILHDDLHKVLLSEFIYCSNLRCRNFSWCGANTFSLHSTFK